MGRHGPVGDGAEPVQVPVNDLLAVERERDGASHHQVVERRLPRVEHDADRKDLGVVEHRERGVLAHERRMGRLDAREVDLSRRERGELRGRLVHHDHDEAVEPWGAAERRREGGIGGEHPAAMGLVRHEPERAVSHRSLVPRRSPQLTVRDGVEQVGRQHGQVREHVGERALRATESQDHGRIVGIVHEGERGEVVEPRVSRRRIARRVDGPRHVAGRRGHPVMPAHPGREPERQRLLVSGPPPRAGEVGLRVQRGVVPRERGEEHVALHLLGERMDGEQRIDGLELGAGGVDDGAPPARGARPARPSR